MKATQAQFRGKGGIHPVYHKDLSRDKAIEVMPVPALLIVSMAQHLGAPAKPIVKKGDTVLRGQCIGEAAGFISAAVHAPTSGTVKLVASATTTIGGTAPAITIEPDGEDRWIDGIEGIADWKSTDPKTLIAKVAAAGIAGMGGAGFPTNVKLSPPPDKPIDTLILNGAECEPYLTADHRLMVERADQIWEGCQIIQKILGAKNVRIAIEDNKPESIASMQQAMANADENASIVILKTEYPQGAEKQQIYATTGREVPSGKLPMDVGCVVENVGTTQAVWDAVVNGTPLTERVTTVTGTPVDNPRNVLGRIGTPYSDLLEFCGGLKHDAAKIISGGPMMGLAQPGLTTTTTKTTSGLLFLTPSETKTFKSMPCIACGRCIEACPMHLVPAELSQMLEAEDYDAAEELSVLDCIECGCCAFACPAHRPLVQHMKQGKSKVILKRREAQKKT
jgi:electron transport complex protein RnfC